MTVLAYAGGTQNWTNADGLFLQFGTDKASQEVAGEFQAKGTPNRIAEVLIDLSLLNTTAAVIVSNTTFFPAGQNIYIEYVEAIAEVGMSTSSSPTLSVGLVQDDRTTVPTNGGTAFINAAAASTLDTAGKKVTYVNGTSGAGGYIGVFGTQWNTNTPTGGGTNTTGGYITAKLGTATATGKIRVRIHYHGTGSIPY
jgi:hypothetical protein